MKNNEVIDHPDYYRLKRGGDLEDVIAPMPFDVASAVKYMFRAGRKNGEAEGKDVQKAWHYVMLAAKRTGVGPGFVWRDVAECLEYCGKPDKAAMARGNADSCGYFFVGRKPRARRRVRWPGALALLSVLAAWALALLRYEGASVALVLVVLLAAVVRVVVGQDDRTGGPSR